MFERYTEKARRVIFFSRYEASQHGSDYIEPEHLLLGLTHEAKPMFQSLLQGSPAIEKLRKDVEEGLSVRSPTSTSVDLPLSSVSKQVLEYAGEESANAGHHVIGDGHLLIGLLRQEGSAAARLLSERGFTRELILAEMERPGRSSPAPNLSAEPPSEPMSRELVHSLVDAVPQDRLFWAAYMLRAIKSLPAGRRGFDLWGLLSRQQEHGQAGKPRYTSRLENGVLTVETHHRFDEHDIDILERWSFSQDGKILQCARETTVDQRLSRSETEFDIS